MSEQRPGIAAVILAAGASTRLGKPKQLIRIENESLLRRTVRLALESGCAPVFVVLGYEAERMQPELDGLAAIIVVNEQWAEGMGSSLRRGMEVVLAMEPQPAGVMLLVCDQPELTVSLLGRLRTQHGASETRITASGYVDRAGVPAIFGREFFADLIAVEGDRGAREVIRRHADRVSTIPWPEGEIDLDEPDDLARLQEP